MRAHLPLVLLMAVSAAVGMASCRASGAGAAATPVATASAAKVYPAVGVIEGFQADNKVITIRNQAIPGFMEAMSMDYELQSPALAQGLKAGDAVDFTITVQGDDYSVTALKKR